MIGAEETVYVDQMYEVSSASDNPVATINVYLGDTRLVSKLANLNDPNATTESRNTFYYHADQLGNSSLITDYAGEEYERMSFTPHGEVWQHSSRDTLNRIDLLFTGKGLDQETGWYYFGARYLDPKTGLWLSGDPAMEEYIPRAPLTDDDKKANKDLPGMGGVYNPMNLATYHYAGNNPVRYIDPDGRAPGVPSNIDQVLAQREYERIISFKKHDPDRALKLMDNVHRRIPDFDQKFDAAANTSEEALANFYQESFPGFEYEENGSPLATQINVFLQGASTPVKVGFTLSGIGSDHSISIDTEGTGRYDASATLPSLFKFNFDITFGTGGSEMSLSSKLFGGGILFRDNYKGKTVVGGFSVHIGPSIGKPFNVTSTVQGVEF